MRKALDRAALGGGAVAAVATGVGAAAGAGLLGAAATGAGGTVLGLSVATISTIGAISGIAAAGLSLAAGLTAKKPSAIATGSQTQFSADPDAAIPYIVGASAASASLQARSASP